jgi:transcriptional regulator with XRE-family HTH domain
MARIRSLAGLSLREWADVFDVTHTTIKHWTASEPDRPKLERVLAALEQASRYRSDLSGWLMASVPGTELRPIDLLREERWRAFDGAVHSQPAEAMTISAEELRRLRRLDESWLLAEPPIEHE